MLHRNVYQRLGNRVSAQVQLLDEEKWLEEALSKIKRERNCLQIERLHVESLKANLKQDMHKKESTVTDYSQPSTSAQADYNTAIYYEEELCNKQELNLMVSDRPALVSTIIEDDTEEEEEEDDEEFDEDDMLIDINMLMYGNKKE